MVGWQSILQEVNANLPIRENPREGPTPGKSKEVCAEQARAAKGEEDAWAAVRGERCGRWPRARVVEGAGRRLRPRRTFIKELLCGSLMLTWMAATTLGLPVSQPDDIKDGIDYLDQGRQQ